MLEKGDPHLGFSPSIIDEDNKRREDAERERKKRLQEEASHFVFDEHSGRITGDMAARDGGARVGGQENILDEELPPQNSEANYTPRMDMRAAYNKSDFNISSENRGAMERMSGGGRMIFEGLLKIPGINRVTAKLGMKYEQFWLDRRNEKTRKIGLKVQRLEAQSKVHQKIAAKMEANPNRGFIKERILELRKHKIAKLERDKEKYEAEIATHEASAKLYAEKRDQVADWLIAYYGEKITPLETKREKLKADLIQFDEENAPMEEQFKEWEAEIKDLESQKAESIKELAATGMSAKEVAKEVAYFDKLMKEMRNELKERDELRRRRGAIEQKIAKANEKLVKMDKRKEYVDAKNGKALIFRPKPVVAETPVANGPDPDLVEEAGEEVHEEVLVEASVESATETFKAGEALANWNAYISEKVAKGFEMKPVIDAGEFLQKSNLQEGELAGLDVLKQKIRDFYEAKYPTEAALKSDIDWVLKSWTGNNEITGGEAAEDQSVSEDGAEHGAEQKEDKNGAERELAENKKYPANDLVKAWNIFTKKNAGANNHLDLTVDLKDLARENNDLGQNPSVERFKKAIFDSFVTNNLGGDQYKKTVEQSLEGFAKQTDQLVVEARQIADKKQEAEDGQADVEAENGAEDIKTGIDDLGRQWLDFAKKRFASRRDMNVNFKPEELKRAAGVPDDGMVNTEEFRAILNQFYGDNFQFARGLKQELEKAIDEFIEENEEKAA